MSDLGDFTDFDGDDEGGAGDASDDTATNTPTEQSVEDDDFERIETTPAARESGLGVLSAANGLRISEEEDESVLRAYITVQNRSRVRLRSLAPSSPWVFRV